MVKLFLSIVYKTEILLYNSIASEAKPKANNVSCCRSAKIRGVRFKRHCGGWQRCRTHL